MIIKSLVSKYCRIPLRTTMIDSTHSDMTDFEVIMVKLEADDGAQGLGYTSIFWRLFPTLPILKSTVLAWNASSSIPRKSSTGS